MYVKTYWRYRVRTKQVTKLKSSLDLWPFDPKMYKYLPLTILHPCMKYERCTLKTTQVIVSEAKCWQSSVVTLTPKYYFDPKIYRCPSICVWNIKFVGWEIFELSHYNEVLTVLTKFSCDLDLWPFDPKIYRCLPLPILYLCIFTLRVFSATINIRKFLTFNFPWSHMSRCNDE